MIKLEGREPLLDGGNESLGAVLSLGDGALGREAKHGLHVLSCERGAVDVGAGSSSGQKRKQFLLADVAARPPAHAALGAVAHIVSLAAGEDERDAGAVLFQLGQPLALHALQGAAVRQVEAHHHGVAALVSERPDGAVGRSIKDGETAGALACADFGREVFHIVSRAVVVDEDVL